MRKSSEKRRIKTGLNGVNGINGEILLMSVPCSFHSCQKLFWGEHKGISEFRSDEPVTHGSAGINKEGAVFRMNRPHRNDFK